MKRDHQIIHKIALAFSVAIGLSWLLNLPGAVTSGILAIISIQPTKTDTLLIIAKRLLSATLGFALALWLWEVFGYTLAVYVLVGLLFIPLSYAINLGVGVVPTLVLAGTLLNVGSFDLLVLTQTSMTLGVSVLVGALVTFVYPNHPKQALKEYADATDQLIQESLRFFRQLLQEPADQLGPQHAFESLDQEGKALIEQAELTNKDFLFHKDNSLYAYLRMRQSQMNRVRRLFRLVQSIESTTPYAEGICLFVDRLIPAIGEVDQATPLRGDLVELTNDYRKKPLPTTREEFEVRAILFQMLFELDAFLAVKIQYHQQLAK
jgi:uncharacterized membrane protein YgaE (UPF0421/DUF939 family)